jgi:hypothetical protein
MFEFLVALPALVVWDMAEPGFEALAGLSVLALGTLSARLIRRVR